MTQVGCGRFSYRELARVPPRNSSPSFPAREEHVRPWARMPITSGYHTAGTTPSGRRSDYVRCKSAYRWPRLACEQGCHVREFGSYRWPGGGVKGSGYGRFGGKAGINEFTDLRWITIETEPGHHPI
jgi:hypothetical protein